LQRPFFHENRVCLFSFFLTVGRYVMLSSFCLCYALHQNEELINS
jgi:hypothetical protein